MGGFLVVLAFLVLFMLGFPVVLAIAMPCLAYIFVKDLPLDLIAQRTLYSLDSFPLVAVPVLKCCPFPRVLPLPFPLPFTLDDCLAFPAGGG